MNTTIDETIDPEPTMEPSMSADELLGQARAMAMRYIRGQTWAYPIIARETMPFIRRARDLVMETEEPNGGNLDPDRAIDILEKFLSAMRYYASVTGLEPILRIDLTREPL